MRDTTVRLWDYSIAPPAGRGSAPTSGALISSVCRLSEGGRTLLATGSKDGSVRLWDPEADFLITDAVAQDAVWIYSICAVRGDPKAKAVLAVATADGKVRLRDTTTGGQVGKELAGRQWPQTMCAIPSEESDRMLLATGWAGGAHTVVLWDVRDPGRLDVRRLPHHGRVWALCPVAIGPGRTLLAVAGDIESFGALQLWDYLTASKVGYAFGEGAVRTMCAVRDRERTLLATGGAKDKGVVRRWDRLPERKLATLSSGTRP